jgi:GNAT superfamily N-acetyltransferase
MEISIRPASHDDMEALVQLSLLAWVPVFRSFKHILGSSIYPLLYPDWERQQREEVERVFKNDAHFFVWIAEKASIITGFIVYTCNKEEETGEVELLAVHPDYQNQGIGTALNTLALDKMKAEGVKLAIVATGGDPGHAPARRSYEKAGYTALPLVRYYKDL